MIRFQQKSQKAKITKINKNNHIDKFIKMKNTKNIQRYRECTEMSTFRDQMRAKCKLIFTHIIRESLN